MMRRSLVSSASVAALLLAAGCTTTAPPPQPAIEARVLSVPGAATVEVGGSRVGETPLVLRVADLAEVLEIRATLADQEVVETRVRIMSPTRVEVTFRFGAEPGEVARRLGLTRVLVFDYDSSATFDVDRWDLKPVFEPLLVEQAAVLNELFAGVELFVCGHTDDTGGTEHNLELSLKRAQSVAAFLAEHGVEPGRMVQEGFGEDYPIDTNATAEGRTANRRTEIVLPQ